MAWSGVVLLPAEPRRGFQASGSRRCKVSCAPCGYEKRVLMYDIARLRRAGLQPWARAHTTRPMGRSANCGELIRRIEADLHSFSDRDRAQIQQAVTAIRVR